MRPTFSGFSIARQGLDAARANLQVTGQNMTNANSIGYTRQRVDTYARGAGNGGRYASTPDAYIGQGVQITGVSQLRDPYLDVRFRREHAKAGDSVAQFGALTELGYIFGSATQVSFNDEFSSLVKKLEELSKTPTDPVAGKIVKTQATTLLQLFNECADRLQQVGQQQIEGLRDEAILSANDCLSNIARLNEEIRSAQVSGNPALELLDQRNLMLDELAQYVNIEVVTSKVDIGNGVKVDELSVNLLIPHGEKISLIDNGAFTKFALTGGENGVPVGIQLQDSSGKPIDSSLTGLTSLEDGEIGSLLTTGSFVGYLNTLNNQGEFGDPPSTDRGIPYYEKMFDNLAATFAKVMNAANSTDAEDKPLFEAKDGGTVITAANIVISKKWDMATDNYITNTKKLPEPGVDLSEERDNILYMISLFSEKNSFTTTGEENGYPLFSGTFQECVSNIVTTHGLQMRDLKRQNDTNISSLNQIDSQRQSISAVNVDEEGINLIMFNQALTAASRYMTTLDEAVDTIINRMGIVGR